jgi:hypothetical protein
VNDLTFYRECAPLMETGDTLLYIGRSFVAKAIQSWTRHFLLPESEPDRPLFNHGNLVLRFREYEVFIPRSHFRQARALDPNRRWVLDARASGIYPVLLSDYLAAYDGSVYWYPLKDEFSQARQAIGCYAMDLAGKGYDFLGLLENAVRLVSADMARLFCSETLFLCYRDGGHIVTGEKTPRPDMVPLLGVYKDPIKLF